MLKFVKTIVALALIATISVSANAAGFSLYEWDARGNAMGGAVMANKASAASISANPALITQLEGNNLMAGLTIVSVNAKTIVGGQERAVEPAAFYIPNVYFAGNLNDNVYFGLGIFTRFGLGETYKDYKSWIGSYTSAYYANLETFSINPNIAVKVNEELSLAMGIEVMSLTFEEKKYAPAGALSPMIPVDGDFKLKGDSIAWGGNFGAFYNPKWAEKWAAGLTYRTKVRHVASGKVTATGGYALVPGIESGDAEAALVLPDSIAFGISFQATEKLILETNVTGTFWSSYDKLKIDYVSGTSLPTEHKNWNDVVKVAIGAEYNLTEKWDLRAGYFFDQSPINKNYMDTLVPAHDRNVFSVGAGHTFNESWGLDFSLAYLKAANVNGTLQTTGGPLPISYKDSSSMMFGLNARYSF